MRRLTHLSPAVKLWSYQVLGVGVARSSSSTSSNIAVGPPLSASPESNDKNESNFSKHDFYRYLDLLRSEMNANFKSIDTKIQSLESKMDTKIQGLESKMDTKIQSLESKMDTKIQSLESKMDTKIQSLESKIDIHIQRIDSGMNWLKVGIGTLGAMGLFIANMLHQNQLQLKQDLGNQFKFMNQRLEQFDRRFEILTSLIQSQSAPGLRPHG